MRRTMQPQTSFRMREIVVNFYLLLVACYLFLGAAALTNILINLTVESNIGFYFEFLNPSADRLILHILSFITMLHVTTRLPRKEICSSLLFIYVFISYFIFMQIADLLMVLASFVVLTWSLTSPKPFSLMSRKKTVSLVAFYLVLILIVIEFLSLICWFVFPFLPKLSQEGTCRSIVDMETKMFLLTGCLAPLLAVLFLFSWITKLFSHYDPLKRFLTLFAQDDKDLSNAYPKKTFISLLLVCSVAFSLVITFYPYLPRLNVDTHPIGVDIPLYEKWLLKIGNGDWSSVFAKSFFEYPDRPFSLFAMYLLKAISGLSASTIAQFFPLILSPFLVFAVYFFVQETIDSDCLPALAAFLSVSSFHVSVGMYAGFLSNWMAIIELYLFMGFFVSYLRNKAYSRIIVAFLLSISLLFTHSGAWGMTMGILLVYLLLTFLKRKTEDDSLLVVRILLVIVLVNISVGLVRNYALGWSTGEFNTLKVAQTTVSIGSLRFFWDDVLYTFLHTMYGFFINPIALLLAVFGGFTVVLDGRPVSRYLTSWLIASCIFFVLGSGWGMKSRILFNIPLPVFESLGLLSITNLIQRVSEPNKTSSIKLLTIIFVLLVNLNYAFRCAFTMSQVVYDLFP